MIKSIKALEYLDDIAHGRKMRLDPHELKLIVEKELKALAIIKKACIKYPELRATIGIACIKELNLILEVLDND